LGGLAVHCLSHAAVLLGLDSSQSWQGVRCIIRSLGLIDGPPRPLLMVQAMDSYRSDDRAKDARARFLQQSYDAFTEHFYNEGDVPDIAGEDEPHYPFRIPYSEALMGYQKLTEVVPLITNSPYVEFVAKIEEMASKGRNDDVREDS
ncbi:MAG TPA: hypothetical protein PLL20_19780, partial [Phycisphaerae bacterium]|nr:hypothetical protein [Phycisphaerae bacterium]